MSTFKKTKVIMLPTNEKTKHLMVYSDVEKTNGKLILNGLKNDEYKEYQHFHIISDDEIKEGDWFVRNNEIHQCYKIYNDEIEFKTSKNSVYCGTNTFWNKNYCKKIIATTDTSLYTYQKETISLPERVFYLPQPSQQFIQKFVEEYNRGNIVTDVLVEYENTFDGKEYVDELDAYGYDKFKSILKVNPKDNTITIKKVKDSYTQEEVDRLLDEQASRTTAEMLEKFKDYKSKEEVIDLIMRAVGESHDWSQEHNDIHSINIIEKRFLNKWIEENL